MFQPKIRQLHKAGRHERKPPRIISEAFSPLTSTWNCEEENILVDQR
jgi:hypothetical protein